MAKVQLTKVWVVGRVELVGRVTHRFLQWVFDCMAPLSAFVVCGDGENCKKRGNYDSKLIVIFI